ncbi:transcriptional regulator NrdR [bacterium]|nr:transcriptional regulator NrdR [bacterium]MCB2201545.1 transcriptional regulator NrdR [bacterium]
MRCPHCGHEEDRVVDSRPSQDGWAIRRRRECLGCKERYTTYEYVERPGMTVVKFDHRREKFDRSKLMQGIKLACNKRPVDRLQMEQAVDEIEAEISTRGKPEISSHELGEMVMAKLKELDDIAYVRFASVYRKFKDKEEFLEELKRLMD